LNTSGKYIAFKEQLKYSVVKIVREKYLKTTNFQDNNELQVSNFQFSLKAFGLVARKFSDFLREIILTTFMSVSDICCPL